MRDARAWTIAVVIVAFGVFGACSNDDSGPTRESASSLAPVTTTTVVNELPIADITLSCVEARQQADPMVVVRAFRAARLAGRGAEGCITTEALANYCDVETCDDEAWMSDPGPICLYRCPDAELEDIAWYSAESEPPQYILRIKMAAGRGSRVGGGAEGIVIGRGVAADASDEGLVVVEATTSS